MNFGDLVLKAREEAGLTRLEVARAAGTSKDVLFNIEVKNKNTSLRYALPIAAVLGISLDAMKPPLSQLTKQWHEKAEDALLQACTPLTVKEITEKCGMKLTPHKLRNYTRLMNQFCKRGEKFKKAGGYNGTDLFDLINRVPLPMGR